VQVDYEERAGRSAEAALQYVDQVGLKGGYLVKIPKWAQKPGKLERNWILITTGVMITGWVTNLLYKNSRLNGSNNLDNFLTRAKDSVTTMVRENVWGPIAKLGNELSERRSDAMRKHNLVTPDVVALSKRSLDRMLHDFEQEVARSKDVEASRQLMQDLRNAGE